MSTTTSTDPAIAASTPQTARRVALASLVGTALESYDFYIYAYFAAFFAGPLFFDPLGDVGSRLAAFLTIAVSFLVRPIGAVLFGQMGDRIGRRKTLLVTILIMGVATGFIGLLPTYAMAGWLGAALLVLLRLAQGVSLGGEWGGSILIASEHSSRKSRAFWAALPQLGSPIGSILSALFFIALAPLLNDPANGEWAWRIPFLTAIPLVAVSLYLRWSIDETPVFKSLVAGKKREKLPVLQVFREQPVALVTAIAAALLGIGSYSLMNTYTVSYGVTNLGFQYDQLLIATTIGGLLQLVTIPLFGWWATKIGSARVVAYGALGTLLITFPMYFVLQQATFGILVATMIIGGILPTMSWAALGGTMADLFGARHRYSALSIAYSLAAVVSGFVPAITLGLGEATGFAWWHPGVILGVMSAVTLVGAWAARRMIARRGAEASTL